MRHIMLIAALGIVVGGFNAYAEESPTPSVAVLKQEISQLQDKEAASVNEMGIKQLKTYKHSCFTVYCSDQVQEQIIKLQDKIIVRQNLLIQMSRI